VANWVTGRKNDQRAFCASDACGQATSRRSVVFDCRIEDDLAPWGEFQGGAGRWRTSRRRWSGEDREGRTGIMVQRVSLPRGMIMRLAEGRGLCLQLEMEHFAADSSSGEMSGVSWPLAAATRGMKKSESCSEFPILGEVMGEVALDPLMSWHGKMSMMLPPLLTGD